MLRILLQRSVQHDNYLNPIHEAAASNFQPIMNNQQPTDKAGSPRRLKIMKNDQSIYGILTGSEEKGREAMETAAYATCILSVIAAVFGCIGQAAPGACAGCDPATQPAPVVSHAAGAAWETKS